MFSNRTEQFPIDNISMEFYRLKLIYAIVNYHWNLMFLFDSVRSARHARKLKELWASRFIKIDWISGGHFSMCYRIDCYDGKNRKVSLFLIFFIVCLFFFAINFKVIAVVWWNFITPCFGDLYRRKMCNSMNEMNKCMRILERPTHW